MTLNHVRRGSGSPLLLVHGLGAGWRSWTPIINELAEHREVIAVDLPGFGETPPLTGEVSIATLTDSVANFIREEGLDGLATAGQSMGGRMVLEPGTTRSRRRHRGSGSRRLLERPRTRRLRRHTTAVDCSGPRSPRQAAVTAGHPGGQDAASRTSLSARPWALSPETVLPDVSGLADSPSTGAALDALTKGPKQQGAPAGTAPGRVTIGWGRRDLVTVPRQAARAAEPVPRRGAALVRAVRPLPTMGRTARSDPPDPGQNWLSPAGLPSRPQHLPPTPHIHRCDVLIGLASRG